MFSLYLHGNYGQKIFYKKIFKVFPFGCHGNQNSALNGNILATLKGDHPRIIPIKFREILQCA